MNWIKAWAPRLLTGLAAVALVWALGRSLLLFLDYMRILITFPFNVDYGEGPILAQVMRLSHGQNIYPTDLTSLPFTIGNYPPFYHLLQLPFAWIFGPAFWYGRVINLLSQLAAVVFIALTLYTVTNDSLAAAVGGALLLAIPYILQWSGFVRVDAFALGISWAGLFVIARWPQQRKGLVVAALWLTVAIFTRQSYGLAAPFAAFVWLLSHKPRRRAFELAAWTGGFSLALFVLFNLLSAGGFYFNVISANVNPFTWLSVKDYVTQLWVHMGYLLVTSLIYLALALWLQQKVWWLAAPYLLASTASAITIGKAGSNVNYLFELSAALAFIAGAFLAWPGVTLDGSKWVGRRWGLKLVMMVLLVLQINGLYHWTLKDYYSWPVNRALWERDSIARMAHLVAQAEKPVLADEFMGLIPLEGKPLVFQPFEFKQLVTGGLWDQTPMIAAINSRQFDLILLYDPPTWKSRQERWTPQQLRAIESNYILAERLAQTRVYLPLNCVSPK